MAHIYKIEMKFNLANVTTGQNSFVWQDTAVIPMSDGLVLSLSEDWMEAVWASLRPHIDNGVTLTWGRVVELIATTGKMLRIVGSILPTVNGSLGNQALPWVDTVSMFARTGVPKVRGGKSFAGFTEASQEDGLFNNTALAAATAAAAAWIDGPDNAAARPGVWSKRQAGFVPFVGTGGTTNVPGTRVSRRPGRGI